jgi:hypothetical protein
LDEMGKLGHGFSSVDELEEVSGDGVVRRVFELLHVGLYGHARIEPRGGGTYITDKVAV